MNKKAWILVSVLLVVSFFSTQAFAQMPGSTPNSIAHKPEPRPLKDSTYGTASFTNLWIPASAFMPHNSDVTWERVGPGSGAISKTSGADFESFWAPLNLPNGVDIYWVELHYTDNSTTDGAFICITRYDIDDNYSNDETCEELPDGTPGQTTFGLDPYPNNNIINNRHPHAIHVFNFNTDSANFFFHGVRVSYLLQISPAPVAATFTDVPTYHPFFQEIEALADSGITAGYADGTFKPGHYVTRQAMAAFLARALGLHWPN